MRTSASVPILIILAAVPAAQANEEALRPPNAYGMAAQVADPAPVIENPLFLGRQSPNTTPLRMVRRKRRRRRKLINPEAAQSDRQGRFFSLFTVVRFNNDPCPTSGGRNGTCYTSSDCANRGGVSDGSCASGFGVCCTFEFSCGASTGENGTSFVSPPSPIRICNLMVSRLNDDICQIRLELDTFDLAAPNAEGDCQSDFFLVTGVGTQVPQLCGLNSGQHVVYSITSQSGPTQLSVIMDTAVSVTATRAWKIRIYQIGCGSDSLAPVGCLQYFTAVSGEISSFNYKSTVVDTNSNLLSNLNYAICIRVANGYCGIRYSQVTSDPNSFTISEDVRGSPPVPIDVKLGYDQCTTDYLLIPGGSADGTLNAFSRDRFCGLALGPCVETGPTTCSPMIMAVTSLIRPFSVHVVTDGTTNIATRGFRLNYDQTPCLFG